MVYPDFNYVDVAIGSPAMRNHVHEISAVGPLVQQHPGPVFATWRRFPHGYVDHWHTKNNQGHHTVAGYPGPCYADFLLFDFDGDGDGDLEATLTLVRNFLAHLQASMGIDPGGVRCAFSGNRGFHLCLAAALFGGGTPAAARPAQQRQAALTLANGFAVDDKMYDTNRLLRLVNTPNPKSGLYKIPLGIEELIATPIRKILEWAESPRQVAWPGWEEAPAAPACVALWQSILQGRAVPVAPHSTPHPAASVFALTGLREGDGRDNCAFSLACEVRRQGGARALALEVLKMWDRAQAVSLGDGELAKKIKSAYKNSPKDGEAEDSITIDDIKTPKELVQAYRDYVVSLRNKRVLTGWPQIDRKLRAIAPGEVVTIMARSGVGKSAAVQNILRTIATEQHLASLFCSMEQPAAQVFERYAQMSSGKSGEEVERLFDKSESRQEMADMVVRELGERTLTVAKSGLSLHQIEEALRVAQEKIGTKVDVLVVDYLGMTTMQDLGYSTYEQVSNMAKAIKALALNRGLVIFLLCQVGRKAGEDGNTPLTRSSARDSGAIEESADYLLGLYRDNNNGKDNTLVVQVLKNRKGFGAEVSMEFDRDSMRITERTFTFLPTQNGQATQGVLWYQMDNE